MRLDMRRLVAALLAAIAVMLLGASAIAGANPAPPTVAEQVEAPGTSVDTPPTQADVEAEAPPDSPDASAEEPIEVLLFGGSGNPEGHFVENFINKGVVPPNANITRVKIEADFWPAFGGITGLTYDESRRLSIPEAMQAIRKAIDTGGRQILIVDYSQSGSTVSLSLEKLDQEGDDLGRIKVTHISNPKTVETGLESRIPSWLKIPGITATGPAMETPGISYCRLGDPICNAPCTLDGVNLAAAIAAYLRDHPAYYDVDLSNARIYTENGITYITIDDGKVALIEQLREWGVDFPLLTAWIKSQLSNAPVHGPRGTCTSSLQSLLDLLK